jgi:dTDP-glucose 4,6-dehydratase
MRVLVTGGAGFIGSHFVKLCLQGAFARVSEVLVLDSLTYAGNLDNFTTAERSQFRFIKGDICDPILLESVIPSVDAIINFAAESHVDRSIIDSSSFMRTNAMGVLNLLEVVRRHPNVRFLQVSTDEVYGSIAEGSWIETNPLLPNSPYSASKASGELLVRSYVRTYGLDCIVTRSSNNYGTNHYPEKLIPLFITNLIEGKKVPVYGSGQNVRDWLHVNDHCMGIYLALTNGKGGEIYNIGGGTELSNLEITQKILAQFSKSIESIEFVADRLGHDLRYSVNWQKAKNELGYVPTVTFDLGLKDTVQWYLSNPQWWKPLKQKA